MTPIMHPIPTDITLCAGSHASFDQGVCAMEFAAYLAGEPHSDEPTCVCPAIRAFCVSWNDALPSDAERNRLLLPLVPRTIDSKSTPAVQEYRAFLAFDWLTRIYAPTWLDLLPELAADATALRALAPILTMEAARAAIAPAEAASERASVAESAARSAAWSAAGSAVWSAARSAAVEALRPTCERLEASALDLVDRMLAVTPETLPAGWIAPSKVTV